MFFIIINLYAALLGQNVLKCFRKVKMEKRPKINISLFTSLLVNMGSDKTIYLIFIHQYTYKHKFVIIIIIFYAWKYICPPKGKQKTKNPSPMSQASICFKQQICKTSLKRGKAKIRIKKGELKHRIHTLMTYTTQALCIINIFFSILTQFCILHSYS